MNSSKRAPRTRRRLAMADATPESVIDFERVRLEVFEKTGLRIGSNDPIMGFLVAHGVILECYEERFGRLFDEATEQLQGSVVGESKQKLESAEMLLRRAREFFYLSIGGWCLMALIGGGTWWILH